MQRITILQRFAQFLIPTKFYNSKTLIYLISAEAFLCNNNKIKEHEERN